MDRGADGAANTGWFAAPVEFRFDFLDFEWNKPVGAGGLCEAEVEAEGASKKRESGVAVRDWPGAEVDSVVQD